MVLDGIVGPGDGDVTAPADEPPRVACKKGHRYLTGGGVLVFELRLGPLWGKMLFRVLKG